MRPISRRNSYHPRDTHDPTKTILHGPDASGTAELVSNT
jgi:hypothetical protein